MTKQYVLRSVIIVFLPLIIHAQGENWIYRYNGPGDSTDDVRSMIYGADSNIYIAGGSMGDGSNYDFTVISLTTAGDTNWVYRYNGPGNGDDWALSIVYGADGNIYAAGGSTGIGSSLDCIVICLTTAGDTNWTYRYNGPGNFGDCLYSIVYGTNGNIYTAGTSYGNDYNADYIVISLTTAGDTNWTFRYNGPGNGNDIAHFIAFNGLGSIYVAGRSQVWGSNYDIVVLGRNTAGDTNWVYRYNGPADETDDIFSFKYGADRNLYIAGVSSGTGLHYYDFTVISLSTFVWGYPNWIFTYNGQEGVTSNDAAYSVVYGTDSNIYAAGYTFNGASSSDLTVMSFNYAGDTNWVYRYNGPGNYVDWANSIVYGADGNIYVAGASYGNSNNADFIIISLTTAGDTNWTYRYNGPGNGDDEVNSIIHGPDGNIYAAGNSFGIGTDLDFTVISLPSDFGVEDENNTTLKTSFGATILSGPLRLPKGKTCRVFDITGREVMPDRISPGIYFIQIDGIISQKVIKVR